MSLSIRPATPADAVPLSLLGTSVWIDTYADSGLTPAVIERVTERFDRSTVEQLLADPRATAFVAEWNGGTVGCAWLQAGSPCPAAAQRTLELTTMYVLRRCHGRGIGAALWARCRDHANTALGSGALWLRVNSKNTGALAFYARQGLQRVGSVDVRFDGVDNENFLLAEADAARVMSP